MLTNGFAYFKGDGAPSLARDAARRGRRYAREVLVSTDGEFRKIEGAPLSGKREVALAFSLEKGGFPLVHGYAGGEFCLLGKGTEGVYGARDALGTRGLWAVKSGPGAGSIASDYRMLEGAALVPPGTAYVKGEAVKAAERREEDAGTPSFEEAAKALASLIDGSVRGRVQGQRRVAVSFSGGLDSSLLALVASRYSDVVLCSAYASGSRDEGQSRRAAALLGLELETGVLDAEALAKGSRGAELPPGEATLMDKALWCIYSTTSALAKRRNARMILLGQLADELFGGYMKYAIKAREEGAGAAEAMMRQDARACADRGFLRDEAACSASCEVRFPYADGRIASFAARLPLDYKIRDGERKAVLRAAALELGLPEELASTPKKAAQFSSGAAKLLGRR
ncbi:MAG TPA: asparagine synthase-related protein [Nitrososphaerales archaeon]|nr:asparagine synthase-related protein [Nitrososphaerales archaeon]